MATTNPFSSPKNSSDGPRRHGRRDVAVIIATPFALVGVGFFVAAYSYYGTPEADIHPYVRGFLESGVCGLVISAAVYFIVQRVSR